MIMLAYMFYLLIFFWRYNEGEKDNREIHFNLMAIVADRKLRCQKRLEELLTVRSSALSLSTDIAMYHCFSLMLLHPKSHNYEVK